MQVDPRERAIEVGVRLLGRFSVRRDHDEIPPAAFGGRLVRTLIRILVARRGEFVSRDALSEALWSGRQPADPSANLNVLVNRARRALGDPALIITGPRGYSFALERCLIDAEIVLAHVAAAREHLAAGHTVAALRDFRTALDRWGGEPLAEDAYEEWSQDYRRMLSRAYLEALEGAAAAALSIRDPGQAVALAELAVAREPLREGAHLLLVRALTASGDTAAALEAFDALRHRLADELGLDPSPEALQLQTEILQGEPPDVAARRPIIAPATRAFEDLPFVGRDLELEAIQRALAEHRGRVVLVAGPPGSGKSRLLAEVAVLSPTVVVSARAFLGEREEAWALARSVLQEALAVDVEAAQAMPERAAAALGEVIPELRELRPPSGPPPHGESARTLALQGAVRLLEAIVGNGGLLIVDDLQWADPTSVALLGLLTRRIPTAGILVAYRSHEVADDEPVGLLLAELRAGSPVSVSLGPLAKAALLQLVADEELATVIMDETDGTPFAITEVLRELTARGAVEAGGSGKWHRRLDSAGVIAKEAARSGKRRMIQSRVEGQPPARRRVLQFLALLRREAPVRLLASASGQDQAVVLDHLDALARAGLVRLGNEGWTTAHDLVSDTIADEVDRAKRGRLHEAIVRALGADADPAELARHLAASGDGEAAAKAYAAAGRRSLDRYENEEAEHLANAGLGLRPAPMLGAELLQVRAEARWRRGALAAAREDLRGAVKQLPPGTGRSGALGRLALLTSGFEDFRRAGELLDMALLEARDDPAARAHALAVGSVIDMNTGQLERARQRSEEALDLFEQAGDAPGLADILEVRGLARQFDGDFPGAREALDRAAKLFEDSGNLLRACLPRAGAGWALSHLGRVDEALVELATAKELARMVGQIETEAWCLCLEGHALAMAGRGSQAIEVGNTALRLARELGHRELQGVSMLCLGLAHQVAGQLETAERLLREGLEDAEHFPYFHAHGLAYLSSVLADRGDLEGAQHFAVRAVAEGTAMSRYETRLVMARVALERREPGAEVLARDAIALAEAGTYLGPPSYRRLKAMIAEGS